MRLWTAIVALGMSMLTGCASTINLEVLQPAALAVPQNVQTLAVVDRSRAKNVGQGVLGVLEGALTGEAIGADTEGRVSARQGLANALGASPRFDVVTPDLKSKVVASSLFDAAGISWELAERICAQENCDGIVTLEAFDSDSFTDVDTRRVEEEVDGKERVRTVYDVERRMSVLTSWQLYDVKNRQVLDNMRETSFARTWTATGDSEKQARRDLPPQTAMVRDVAYVAGEAYGRRIAPSYITVSRTYFSKGDDRFKAAKTRVRGLDWDGAATIWSELTQSSDPKTKGRAFFNLALYSEVVGDLDRAIEQAQKANQILDKGSTRRYVSTLSIRKADQARLADQME
ncbi:MAG: DUF6340 family protein [Myxococcota bacterium]